MNELNGRRFLRIDTVQETGLEFEERSYNSCRIRNLSLTGMFVGGEFLQLKGDEFTIRFSQTSFATHFYFKVRARVVRKMDEAIAIEFVSMPLDSYMLLQTTLLY